MKIFAIDPGNVYSAYCIMDDAYHFIEFDKLENEKVMARMKEWLNQTAYVVIERIASYGLAVGKDVFETCEWIGRFSQEAERVTFVSYVYRKDEKIYLCGDMKAKDTNIRAALIERFARHDFKRGTGTKKNPDVFYGCAKDMWAACAIGTTFLDMRSNENLKKTRNIEKAGNK